MKWWTCSLVALLAMLQPARATAATCESLLGMSLPNGRVTMALAVAPGAFTPPSGRAGQGLGPVSQAYAALPAFCRVAATLQPSSDSDIKIEVWMPAAGWNGKFEGVGNGGWAGTIPFA